MNNVDSVSGRQDVKLALDCTQACLISYDRLVLSLKGGEL